MWSLTVSFTKLHFVKKRNDLLYLNLNKTFVKIPHNTFIGKLLKWGLNCTIAEQIYIWLRDVRKKLLMSLHCIGELQSVAAHRDVSWGQCCSTFLWMTLDNGTDRLLMKVEDNTQGGYRQYCAGWKTGRKCKVLHNIN